MFAENSLLPAVIFLVIGALGGAVLVTLFSGQRTENDPESEQTTDLLRAQPRRPAGLESGNFEKAACLWHDEIEGHLVVEMKGASYATAKEMDPATQEAADSLARKWLAWLGKEAPPAAAPAASAKDLPSLEELKITVPAPGSKAKAAPSIIGKEEKDKTPEIIEESIVVQIDNTLQDMLAGSELESRNIRLTEGANMGVIVWIGSKYFQGIDQVPDPVIAKVIREAVAEWERRSVPNR